ncbi:MAG: antibiotic ABC transporter ATP-binding protein [Flammeovirgaceae bacterium]|nr:antibiotic ABC transporter ATP-binding protein [Flammeovirgaceae bacterium]
MKMDKQSVSGNVIDYKVLKRLFIYCKPYIKQFYLLVFFTISLSILSPIRPFLVQLTIDNHVAFNDYNGMLNMIIILVILLVFQGIIQYYHTYLSGWIGQNIVKDLRIKLYSHIQKLRLKFFDNTPIGKIITRNISDIETIAEVFGQGLASIIGDLLQLIGILIIMFLINWKLTLVTLSTFPLLLLVTYIFKEKVKVSFNNVREAVANLNSFVQERIVGMNVIQIFARESKEYESFKKINRNHLESNLKAVLYYSLYFPAMEFFTALGMGLMIWYGSYQILEDEITLGILIAFIMYLQMFFRPIRMIADRFNVLQMGVVSSIRIFKLLDTKEMIVNNDKFKIENNISGKLEFKNLWFAYNEKNYVLKNINFKINPGNVLAIVGSTGSGKTSIINLINRFYEFNKGEIYLDENKLRDYNLDQLRKVIGYVPQDVFLFSDTVRNNLTLGDKMISDKKIWEVIRYLKAEKFIEKLPGKLNYNVMERGATLSVGQRQLLSCIRILLFDPKIILLDEATSSVDSETEETIQNAISKILKNRTSIVVAHRLSTIKQADNILVLENGEIVESGKHDELKRNNKQYSKLYKMQFSEVTI